MRAPGRPKGERRDAMPRARSDVPRRAGGPGHLGRNRSFWNRTSASYDRRHAPELSGRRALSWGLWRVPESRLQLLAPVRGRRILELGCGAARWSIALARRGALGVGIDLSDAQLAIATQLVRAAGSSVELVHGSAEDLPFGPGRFDVVFCDWGAMTFADPRRVVPEVSRVLRPGGRFVFSAAHPFRGLSFDRKNDRQSRRLQRPYFGAGRVDYGGSVEFQLPFGEWLALFRSNGLSVRRLIETQPGRTATSSYLTRSDQAWGRRWPLEAIWSLQKAIEPAAVRTGRRSARISSPSPR